MLPCAFVGLELHWAHTAISCMTCILNAFCQCRKHNCCSVCAFVTIQRISVTKGETEIAARWLALPFSTILAPFPSTAPLFNQIWLVYAWLAGGLEAPPARYAKLAVAAGSFEGASSLAAPLLCSLSTQMSGSSANVFIALDSRIPWLRPCHVRCL